VYAAGLPNHPNIIPLTLLTVMIRMVYDQSFDSPRISIMTTALEHTCFVQQALTSGRSLQFCNRPNGRDYARRKGTAETRERPTGEFCSKTFQCMGSLRMRWLLTSCIKFDGKVGHPHSQKLSYTFKIIETNEISDKNFRMRFAPNDRDERCNWVPGFLRLRRLRHKIGLRTAGLPARLIPGT